MKIEKETHESNVNKNNKSTNKIKKSQIYNITENKLGKKEIVKYDEETEILVHYQWCNTSKNFIYYKCNKRYYKCPGTCKYDINKNEIVITKHCDQNIDHNILKYEEYEKLHNEGKFNEIDFSNKKYQKYFITATIKNDNNIEIPTIIEKLNKISKTPIQLTNHEIAKIKNNILKPINNLNLEDLCKNIVSENFEIIVKSTDVRYEFINIKKKKITKKLEKKG